MREKEGLKFPVLRAGGLGGNQRAASATGIWIPHGCAPTGRRNSTVQVGGFYVTALSKFRSHPLVAVLVVLLLAVGHGEQIFGQFARHHHEWQAHRDAEASGPKGADHQQGEGDPKRGDNCCLEHLNVIGAVPSVMFALIVNRQQVGLVATSVASRVEAPVRGIDYPPQLS